MIQIRNLSKKYNDFYVLKDINLNLPNKGLIGISGESGSGKSTFLNALSLMDKDYEGEIIINEKNILKFSLYFGLYRNFVHKCRQYGDENKWKEKMFNDLQNLNVIII